MEKVKDYAVVSEEKLADLEKRVRDYIGRGWQPFGNLVIISDTNTKPHFLQPMVLY